MQSLVLSKKEKDGFSEIRGLGEVPRNDESQFLLLQLNAWKNKYTNKKKNMDAVGQVIFLPVTQPSLL